MNYDALSFEPGRAVCFSGHRFISREVLPALRLHLSQAALDAYHQGYRYFLSGGARGFDLLAAEVVLTLKNTHPSVRLIMVLPCGDQTQKWSAADRLRYQKILAQSDQNIILSDRYYEGCMQVRNHFLVDHSEKCICYMKYCRGGTWHTVSYADKNRKIILNLGEM